MISPLNVSLALLPVLLFLAALVFLDSFKLTPLRSVIRSIVVGALVGLAAYVINTWLREAAGVDSDYLRRILGPIVEESLKGLFLVWLIGLRRVGFLVDAAIHGFAVGAGFAVLENIYYLTAINDSNPGLWLIRGFGTALMHGSATAMVAILTKNLTDRHPRGFPWVFLPALGVGIVFHAGFNHLVLPPAVMTLLVLMIVPVVLYVVFERSERATQEWLGLNLDSDIELLEAMTGGDIGETKVGGYLMGLKDRFPEDAVIDMYCLVQVNLELSILAKGVLLARSAGLDVPLTEDVRARLKELHHLERAVGPTGRLAVSPILRMSGRELWQIYMLTRKSEDR
ncbi:MAG: PrsW family glutamic-type intramembrane protease [Candidatus Eisenbacteria bacterium]|nr:PrsW family glutamic-type intramembrane protease [Candidatus Eisenbacteria bacterium]